MKKAGFNIHPVTYGSRGQKRWYWYYYLMPAAVFIATLKA
jgi:hypothetical protein